MPNLTGAANREPGLNKLRSLRETNPSVLGNKKGCLDYHSFYFTDKNSRVSILFDTNAKLSIIRRNNIQLVIQTQLLFMLPIE